MKRSGNPRGRRHAITQVDNPADPAKLRCPEWVPSDGAALFRKLKAAVAPIMADNDITSLLAMCAAYGYAVKAAKELNEKGITIMDERKIPRKNPAVQVWRDQIALFNALATNFGLTPAARAKLNSLTPQASQTLDELLDEADSNTAREEQCIPTDTPTES
jgi:P27 family predicted phage terminase small subunit